jgi:hypothetical protein
VTTIAVIDSDIEGYTLIEQTEDDGTVSRSWAREVIPIQARLNPDAPPATEARTGFPTPQTYTGGMPSAETWQLMGAGTEEQRLAFREQMIAAGHDVTREV